MQGFVVNRFRGDRALLEPGLEMLRSPDGSTDVRRASLCRGSLGRRGGPPRPAAYRDPGAPLGDETLRVAVVRLPRSSNLTDLDPARRRARRDDPFRLAPAGDRRRRPRRGARDASHGRRPALAPTPGHRRCPRGSAPSPAAPSWGSAVGTRCWVCRSTTTSRAGAGTVEGLGLLPVRHHVRRREGPGAAVSGTLADGTIVEGYEIHHGTCADRAETPLFADEGCRVGLGGGHVVARAVRERRASDASFLTEVGPRGGSGLRGRLPTVGFDDIREARFERLADMVADHLDTEALVADHRWPDGALCPDPHRVDVSGGVRRCAVRASDRGPGLRRIPAPRRVPSSRDAVPSQVPGA